MTDFSKMISEAKKIQEKIKDAQENIGEEIKDVVITVPAYFGVNEKEATKQAGELAGITDKTFKPANSPACFVVSFSLTPKYAGTVITTSFISSPIFSWASFITFSKIKEDIS